jgi:hypothetical protein
MSEHFPNLPPKPTNDDELHQWLIDHLGIAVARVPVCAHHHAPFDYVRHAFNEPASDLVVWAPRGGGKTRLAAAVTVLDLLYKPGTAVRILGGSLEQSLKMWDHLVPDLRQVLGEQFDETWNRRRTIRLANGSSVAVLTQSQRAVRGLRIQKLRCDEVESFKPDVWEAAQLVTRSIAESAGCVEAISTLHTPWGMMMKIVDRARASDTTVLQWCLLDVLERCGPERACETCPLWDACQGVAKTKCNGFVRIDDAIAMKRRVSRETWESEILCLRPATSGAVFPHFDPAVHVRDRMPTGGAALYLGVDFGFAAPFVCLWIMESADGARHVIDEYVQHGRVTHEHVEQIRLRPWGEPRALCCDPAGKATNDQTATSNVDALRAAGFLVKTRHTNIVDGVELIRVAIRPAEGEPTLFIHPRCVRLIKAIQCYRYGERTGELPLKDGEHDHLVDALRYYFVNRRVGKSSWSKY